MNTFSMISAGRLALAIVAIALLGGCAASGSSTMAARPTPGNQSTLNGPRDADYMAAVERLARVRGVHVVWVNPPPEKGKTYIADSQ
jgi:hypothetical protein